LEAQRGFRTQSDILTLVVKMFSTILPFLTPAPTRSLFCKRALSQGHSLSVELRLLNELLRFYTQVSLPTADPSLTISI
jgi:hypothetical protein